MVEVAHDFVPKIKNWLLAQNIQNSFDTWHGKTCYAFSAGKSTCISTKRELKKKKKRVLLLLPMGSKDNFHLFASGRSG